MSMGEQRKRPREKSPRRPHLRGSSQPDSLRENSSYSLNSSRMRLVYALRPIKMKNVMRDAKIRPKSRPLGAFPAANEIAVSCAPYQARNITTKCCIMRKTDLPMLSLPALGASLLTIWDILPSSLSQLEQFAHTLDLRAAYGNLRVFLVVHFQHVGGIEPGQNFLDVMDVHQEGAVRLPERFRFQRFVHLLERTIIRRAFDVPRHHRDHAAINRSPDQVLAVHQQ